MKDSKKLIVITGGAGGIGQACAKAFKDQPIILTDYSQEKVDEAVAKFSKEGFDVSGIACDITDRNDIKKLTDYVAQKGRLKALVHTAG
ncbi:MAG TPA: short-chain dehydrogenase, partial [Aequorivita sp.]|nr:short-chain dehydrogenase [Aequorivita sp.]